MSNYLISFKIKDYIPKINSISFKNYLCILINGDFQIRIPLISNNYSFSKHELKNTKYDAFYKISLFDNKNKLLISTSDFIIPYKIFKKINNKSFIYDKEIKFLIGMKTKLKLFGSLNKIGDMLVIISAKIFKKTKNILSKSDIINDSLIRGITEQASFSQRMKESQNLMRTKVVIQNNIDKSKSKNKNKKEDAFYSDSNRHISTNDLSGNPFNTFSINEDTENNNSSIGNKFFNNYYYFNTTSGKDELKRNKNLIESNNLSEYKIKNNDICSDNNDEGKLLEKRNNIRKKLNFNNNYTSIIITDRKIQNIKKSAIKNKFKNKINKYKTRNYFYSHKNNNANILMSEDEGGNSMRWIRKKIIKMTNLDNNFNSCEIYSNRNHLSTDSKKNKNKIITSSSIHKNKIDKNKIISLSKGKYDKLLNNKKKYISENILNKALLSDRSSMYQNIGNRSSSHAKRQKKFFKNIKIEVKINENKADIINKKNNKKDNIITKRETINNISSPRLKKTEYIPSNKSKNNNSKEKANNINDNNFSKIKVNKMNKSSNDNNKIIEKNQIELKKYSIKLSEYFCLNNKNIKSIYLKFKEKVKRLNHTKELFASLLKKSNVLEEKKAKLLKDNFQSNKIKNCINKKIKIPLLQIKKKEFNIYQKLFNFSYNNKDIFHYNNTEKLIYKKINNIQISLIKNLIDHYGNISQIYSDDIIKKEKLKNILTRNNILESENKNHIVDLVSLNKINISVKNIIKNTFNNDVHYQFNIIKEVQEEKESEKNSNYINNSQNISNIVSSNAKNSFMNDEILFIDKKESYYEEDSNYKTKKKHIRNFENNECNFKSNNSNSILDSKIYDKSIKEEDSYKKKNIRKELIGMHKKKFKGKILNFDEFCFNCINNKNSKKENYLKMCISNNGNKKKKKKK